MVWSGVVGCGVAWRGMTCYDILYCAVVFCSVAVRCGVI